MIPTMERIPLISITVVLVGLLCGAIADDKQTEKKCVPKRKFVYDHNICNCNDDGTDITCQRELYSTLTPLLYQTQLQNVTQDCTPGESIKERCRECVCDKSGKHALCVRSSCFSEDTPFGTLDKCLPGSVFSDYCNACICGADGKASCTQLDCVGLMSGQGHGIQCVPDAYSVFMCNDCGCATDGKSNLCDRMGCSSINFYHESLLNVTIACDANKGFDYNCHECHCDESGNYAMCNGKPCPHEYELIKVVDTVDKCNPGMIFADDCNVCVCDKNGKGVCTTLSCNTTYSFKYV